VLQQWAIFFGSIAFIGLVVLLVLTFYIKLPYRLWLFTHKFLGLAFFIAGLHVLFITSDTSVNGPLKYYILGFTAIGLIAFIYRTLLGNILIRKYPYHVDHVAVVAGNVAQITLSPVKMPMSYKPGQFVFIRFLYSGVNGITTEWHPFSISSNPKGNHVQLSVKALGDYTSSLVNLKPGAIAEIEGAYGKFSYTNFKNKNQIWIAGGIGISPFLSMAQNLLNDDFYQVDLYYSVKTNSELVDYQKLAEISQLSKTHFRLIPYVSDKHGRLTIDTVEYYSGNLVGKEIFICGPPGMMKGLRSQLKSKGVPPSVVHTEEFEMS
jgi:predicted ferric reductase